MVSESHTFGIHGPETVSHGRKSQRPWNCRSKSQYVVYQPALFKRCQYDNFPGGEFLLAVLWINVYIYCDLLKTLKSSLPKSSYFISLLVNPNKFKTLTHQLISSGVSGFSISWLFSLNIFIFPTSDSKFQTFSFPALTSLSFQPWRSACLRFIQFSALPQNDSSWLLWSGKLAIKINVSHKIIGCKTTGSLPDPFQF